MLDSNQCVDGQIFINIGPVDSVSGGRQNEVCSFTLARRGEPFGLLAEIDRVVGSVNCKKQLISIDPCVSDVVCFIHFLSPETYSIQSRCSRNAGR